MSQADVILTNTTASDISIDDLSGVVVTASGQLDLGELFPLTTISESIELPVLVQAGDIIVSDLYGPLPLEEALKQIDISPTNELENYVDEGDTLVSGALQIDIDNNAVIIEQNTADLATTSGVFRADVNYLLDLINQLDTDLSSVQVRRTTDIGLTTSGIDVSFDTIDLENNPSALDFDDVGEKRIDVHELGLFSISYSLSALTTDVEESVYARVIKNGSTVLNGSATTTVCYQGETANISNSFVGVLDINDYINFELESTSATCSGIADVVFTITHLRGRQGPKGDAGADGIDGTDGQDGLPGTGSTINILNNNVLTASGVGNLNFEGNLEVASTVAGLATVTVSGGSFLELGDVLGSYSGNAGKLVKVNDNETGVEFVDGLTGDFDGTFSGIFSGDGGGLINIDHGNLEGLLDDDHPQYMPADGSRGFTSTISGVYPTEDYQLATKEYVDDYVSDHSFKYLNWSMFPTFNGPVNLLGWNIKTDDNVTLSNSPITTSEPAYHTHVVLNVSYASSTPITVTVSGLGVDEPSREYFYTGENITVTGTGYYQTSTSFVDAPQLFTVESSVTCTCDIYRTTYWDNGNLDFVLRGLRLEWQPDASTWHMQVILCEALGDGSLQVIDDIDLANTDTFPRAGNKKPGKFKITDYNRFINAADNRGLIILVDQSAIYNFSMYLQYSI